MDKKRVAAEAELLPYILKMEVEGEGGLKKQNTRGRGVGSGIRTTHA